MALPSPVLQANRRGSERGDGAGGRCVGHGLGHARSPRSPAWVSTGRWFSPVKPESVGRRAGQGGAYLPVDRARPMSCGACTAGIALAFPPWRGPDTWTVTRGPSAWMAPGRPSASVPPQHCVLHVSGGRVGPAAAPSHHAHRTPPCVRPRGCRVPGPWFLPLPCSPAGAGGSGGGGLAARSAPRWLDSEGALPTRAPAGAPALEGPGRGRGQDGGTPVPVAPRKEIPAVLPHIWPSSDPCFLRHVLPLAPDSSVAPLLSSRLLPAPRPRNLERALGAGQDTSAHALSSSSSAGGSGISHLGGRGRGDAERRCNWPAATQLARAGLGFGVQQDAARAEPLAQRRTAWLWVSACASWDRRVEAGGTRGSWQRPPVSARRPGRAAGAHRPSHARPRCPCGLFTCPWPLGQVPEWQLCPEPPCRPVQHPHLSGVPAFPWELTVPRCVHLCSGGGGAGEVSARPALRNHLVHRTSTSLWGTVSPARV